VYLVEQRGAAVGREWKLLEVEETKRRGENNGEA
jgi:hypothetical protein